MREGGFVKIEDESEIVSSFFASGNSAPCTARHGNSWLVPQHGLALSVFHQGTNRKLCGQ